jgi:transposase InsO family protein
LAPVKNRIGLNGVSRGQTIQATVCDPNAPCPLDHVQRSFSADRQNALWRSDVTYVSTLGGSVYVAFFIAVFARRIAAWRAST